MATFRATFAAAGGPGVRGSAMPVMIGRNAVGLTALTTSGTAGLVQAGGADFVAPNDGFLTYICDGAVEISVGRSPVAAAGTDFYAAANERGYLGVSAGDKVSVIDAA